MPPWVKDQYRQRVIWASFVPFLLPVYDRPPKGDNVGLLIWAQEPMQRQAEQKPKINCGHAEWSEFCALGDLCAGREAAEETERVE